MARKKSSERNPVIYTKEQLEKIEKFIEETFGEISNYFQEKETNDIKLNIYIIPPSREHRRYTLVTAGMGALKMKVPEGLEDKYDRAELVMELPAGWDIESDEPESYWPFHLIKLLSRLPIEKKSWLGWGHTVDYGTNLAPDNEFQGILLVDPFEEDEKNTFEPDEDTVINFYQIIPLYKQEIRFKNKYGASVLLGEFGENYSKILDNSRASAVEKDFDNIIDKVITHSSKIEDKNLDIPEICGANHIAAFFLWIMKHKMLNSDFREFFSDELKQIKNGEYDIRRFLLNCLGGELTKDILTEEGIGFCDFYYNFFSADDMCSYPSDVDNVALDYYGSEKYNCEEFADEAYLFVPYDEQYFRNISKYINKAYRQFKKNISENDE